VPAPVVFDHVSKKFTRGERHDSLRDLIPAAVRRLRGRRPQAELGDREFWALRNVSFEVGHGQALGIIGANGAGKSTTLKLLTRILKPTSGRSAVTGRVGALIEVAAGFHPELTGRENVYLQGAILGMRRAEIDRRFDEIVEFGGVAPFIDTPVKRYSSGMNARLGFSIAAHLSPDVLIIDEVLSVGDMSFQQKCYRRMEEFVRSGASIILVSHNLTAVSQLCDKTLMLKAGEVAAFGPTRDVIAEYSRSQMTTQVSGSREVTLRYSPIGQSGGDLWIMETGARVRFAVEVLAHEPVHGVIGVLVWDLTRQLCVYRVTSESVGLAPLSLDAGEKISYDFEFTANLARGTYALELIVLDPRRQHVIASVDPAATFTITEEVTHNSVANLFLEGREDRVAAQPVLVGEPSLG
jgi:lipopolysaccharide transport system ATP-binding protein